MTVNWKRAGIVTVFVAAAVAARLILGGDGKSAAASAPAPPPTVMVTGGGRVPRPTLVEGKYKSLVETYGEDRVRQALRLAGELGNYLDLVEDLCIRMREYEKYPPVPPDRIFAELTRGRVSLDLTTQQADAVIKIAGDEWDGKLRQLAESIESVKSGAERTIADMLAQDAFMRGEISRERLDEIRSSCAITLPVPLDPDMDPLTFRSGWRITWEDPRTRSELAKILRPEQLAAVDATPGVDPPDGPLFGRPSTGNESRLTRNEVTGNPEWRPVGMADGKIMTLDERTKILDRAVKRLTAWRDIIENSPTMR